MVVAVGIGVGVGVRVGIGVGVVQQIQVFQAPKTVPGESSVGHFLMHWSPKVFQWKQCEFPAAS